MKKLILLQILLFAFVGTVFAQTVLSNGDKIKVQTKDGTILIGTIENLSTEVLSIKTESLGSLDIQRSNIVSMFLAENATRESIDGSTMDEKEEDSQVNLDDMEKDANGNFIDYYNSTQYIANQSAFSLKKGQKYYQNIGIFFNSFTFGVSDNFDISVGGEVISPLFASRFPVAFITPKYTIPLGPKKNAFSISSTIVTVPANDFATAGFLQSAITIGDRNNNFTVGAGVGFTFEDGFDDTLIPLNFSFMKRLGPKISLVSDNFYVATSGFNDDFGLVSLMVRIHFQKNPGAAFNVGLFRPTVDTGSLVAIPMVSAVIPMGKNRK